MHRRNVLALCAGLLALPVFAVASTPTSTFTPLPGSPTVTKTPYMYTDFVVSPTAGSTDGSTWVEIGGSFYVSPSVIYYFDGLPLVGQVVDGAAGKVYGYAPPHAAGPVDVSISDPEVWHYYPTKTNAFTYVDGVGSPTPTRTITPGGPANTATVTRTVTGYAGTETYSPTLTITPTITHSATPGGPTSTRSRSMTPTPSSTSNVGTSTATPSSTRTPYCAEYNALDRGLGAIDYGPGVNDGDFNTAGESVLAGQVKVLDLGSAQDIHRVEVWGSVPNFVVKYGPSAGGPWSTPLWGSYSYPDHQENIGAPVSARYWQLTFTLACNLNEISIYGCGAGAPSVTATVTYTPTASPTASPTPGPCDMTEVNYLNTGFGAPDMGNGMNDGDQVTLSAPVLNGDIQVVDLGSVRDLSKLVTYSSGSFPWKVDTGPSATGPWTSVGYRLGFNGVGGVERVEQGFFTGLASTRYLRLTWAYNGTVAELQAYGCPAPGLPSATRTVTSTPTPLQGTSTITYTPTRSYTPTATPTATPRATSCGSCPSATVTRTLTPTRTWSVTPTATPTQTLGAGPDLVVLDSRITLYPVPSCFSGAAFGTLVTVKNQGSVAAGAFKVGIPNAFGDITLPVAGLAAGASVDIWFDGVEQTYSTNYIVDILNSVAETDEGNNTLVRALPIPTLPPLCDTATPSLTITPGGPTNTRTRSMTLTSTPSATKTATPTRTPSWTPCGSCPSPTVTRTLTPTYSPSATKTSTKTATPYSMPSATASTTPTLLPTPGACLGVGLAADPGFEGGLIDLGSLDSSTPRRYRGAWYASNGVMVPGGGRSGSQALQLSSVGGYMGFSGEAVQDLCVDTSCVQTLCVWISGAESELRVEQLDSAGAVLTSDAVAYPGTAWTQVCLSVGDAAHPWSATAAGLRLRLIENAVWTVFHQTVFDDVTLAASACGSAAHVTPTPPPPPGGGPGSYVYPNPVGGGVGSILVSAPKPAQVKVEILNAGGSLVSTLENHVLAGNSSMAMDLSGFAPGVYYYQVRLNFDDGTSSVLSVQTFMVVP